MASTAKKLDPELWEEAKADARDAYGGHSARAMQYAVKLYKERGGRYSGGKKKDNRLTQWQRQDWTTKSGKPSRETGERYLPRAAIESLTPAEYGATTRAKRRGGGVGSVVAQPPSIREKTRKFRKVNPMPTPAQIAARKKFAERARSGELARMRKKNPTAAARSGMRKKRVTKKDTARADAQFEKKFGFSPEFIEQFGRLMNIYEKQGFTKDEAMKAAKNQVKAMTDALKSVKRNPTATRAPERKRTKLVSNGERKKNPSPKDVFFVNVIDDGGFIYGMDDRTPVTFRFSNRELTRGIYRSFALPYAVTSNPAFQAYAKKLPQGLTVMSLAELKKKLRDFA